MATLHAYGITNLLVKIEGELTMTTVWANQPGLERVVKKHLITARSALSGGGK